MITYGDKPKPDITDDPIAKSLEREDEYWRSIGGRDPEPTYRVGFWERWELMLRELP